LAQEAGFATVLLGGLGVAAERFALPDLGLVTFSDMLDQVRNTCAAVPGFPVIADGDTGYGNALNERRTIIEYARAGAAGILLEDQLWPKQCGHYAGPRAVVSAGEARMKIRAAADARREASVADPSWLSRIEGHELHRSSFLCMFSVLFSERPF
jgi:2-methylisocitrate lyase-like PEP mutase family enzyme